MISFPVNISVGFSYHINFRHLTPINFFVHNLLYVVFSLFFLVFSQKPNVSLFLNEFFTSTFPICFLVFYSTLLIFFQLLHKISNHFYGLIFLMLISCLCFLRLLVVVVTRLLPRDGGIAEDHGAPEVGKLSRASNRNRRKTENRQRSSGAKSPKLDSAE